MMRVVRVEVTSFNNRIYNDFTFWKGGSSELPENRGNVSVLNLVVQFRACQIANTIP